MIITEEPGFEVSKAKCSLTFNNLRGKKGNTWSTSDTLRNTFEKIVFSKKVKNGKIGFRGTISGPHYFYMQGEYLVNGHNPTIFAVMDAEGNLRWSNGFSTELLGRGGMCSTWDKYNRKQPQPDSPTPTDPNSSTYAPKKVLVVRPRCILTLEILERRKGRSFKTGDPYKTPIDKFQFGVSITGKINRFGTTTKRVNFYMNGETIYGSNSVRGNLNENGEIKWSNGRTSEFDGGLCSSDFKQTKPLARMCQLRL
jgi:hypothetical protein